MGHIALRVLFFGNSASLFSNRHFEALSGSNCDIVGLVDAPPSKRGSTNPLPAGLMAFTTFAGQAGLPILAPASPNLQDFMDEVEGLGPDLLLAIGYPHILKPPLLKIPRRLAVNFHASLLPAYRGKHPVFWCLRHGEAWSGLTVHVIDPGIDTGDILYQVRVRTRRDDTVSRLYDRIMDRSVGLVRKLIEDLDQGRVRRTRQSQAGASYFSSITEDDFRLDWSAPVEQLRRWVTMTPGECFTDIGSQRVFWLDAELVGWQAETSPGEILYLGRGRAIIGGGDGALRLNRVRLRGDSVLSAADFFRQLDLGRGDSIAPAGQANVAYSIP